MSRKKKTPFLAEIKRVSKKKSRSFKKDDLWLSSVDSSSKGIIEKQGDLEDCWSTVALALDNYDEGEAWTLYQVLKKQVVVEAIEQGEVLGLGWNITHHLIEKQYSNNVLRIEDLSSDFLKIPEEQDLAAKHFQRIARKYLGKDYLRHYLKFVLQIKDKELPDDLDSSMFFPQANRKVQQGIWYDRDYRELDDKSAWNTAKRIEAIDQTKYPFRLIYSTLICSLVILEHTSYSVYE